MFDTILEKYKSITKQEGWLVKVLIGGLLSFIPVLGHAVVFGYLMNILDDVKDKKEFTLPKWQNIEKLFMDGIPVAVLAVVLGIALMIVGFILGVVPCLGVLLSLLLNTAFGLILPLVLLIAMYRLRATTKWQDALVPGALVEELKKDLKDYFPVLVAYFIANFVSAIVGCCGFLAPITCFYTALVFFPMLAAIYIKKHSEPQAEAPAAPASGATPPPAAPEQPKA